MSQISFPTYITVVTELLGLKETILIYDVMWCDDIFLLMFMNAGVSHRSDNDKQVTMKIKMTIVVKLDSDDDVTVPL